MPGTRRGCVDPRAISPDGLMAWARGEAPPGVGEHIERCPACREQATKYAGIDHSLRTGLLRRTCPSSLTIGEYALGALPPSEMLSVAEHLVECPHCRAESRSFSTFLSEPDEPMPESGILGAVRRLLARPLAAPEPALVGMRGTEDEGTVTYAANGLRLTVSVQPAGPGKPGGVLVGLVQQDSESFTDASARLYAADRLLQREAVDDLGNFLFRDVAPGSYRIEVSVPDAIVEIDAVHVP